MSRGTSSPPVLSRAERDRRWNLVRSFMNAKNLDCLLVSGLSSRPEFDRYLTNDRPGGVVLFPLDGEPVLLTWTTSRIVAHLEDTLAEGGSWVSDVRVGTTGPRIAAVLREKGLERGRVGIVGQRMRVEGNEGIISFETLSYVFDQLLDAQFSEVSKEFGELIAMKSPEEVAMLRRAASIGEKACQAVYDMARPGILESEIYAEAADVILRNGAHCHTSSMPLLLQTGSDNPAWGSPAWLVRGMQPRAVREGDLIQAELFSNFAGLEAQVQISVALNPVSHESLACARIAEMAYKKGLASLKPGRRFGEIVEDMEKVVAGAGAWHLTPLIHSLNPQVGMSGPGAVGIDRLPNIERYKEMAPAPAAGEDIIVKAGMSFSIEGNASMGRHRINVGSTVIVTEDGAEALNQLGTAMRVKKV